VNYISIHVILREIYWNYKFVNRLESATSQHKTTTTFFSLFKKATSLYGMQLVGGGV